VHLHTLHIPKATTGTGGGLKIPIGYEHLILASTIFLKFVNITINCIGVTVEAQLKVYQ